MEVHLHEIGTSTAWNPRAEFVEISNRGSRGVTIGG